MTREYWAFTISAAMFMFFGFIIGTTDYVDYFKVHQTIVAAFFTTMVGGGGIILQLRLNDKNRKSDIDRQIIKRQEELDDQDIAKEEKIKAIAACIHYEIFANSGRLYGTFNAIKIDANYTSDILFEDDFFNIFREKLGYFESDVVFHIAQFYGTKTFVEGSLDKMFEKVNKTPVNHLTDEQKVFIGMATNAIEQALKAAETVLPQLADITRLAKMSEVNKSSYQIVR